MEGLNSSLGLYLQEARSQRGLSLEEAALETNIARKYIEALENDEFGFFPAEMYVTGFLSTYVDILELDKDLVLAMYHRTVNKEKEVPLEYLYTSTKPNDKMRSYFLFGLVFVPLMFIIFGSSLIFWRSSSSLDKGLSKQDKMLPLKDSAFSKEMPIDITSLQSSQEFIVGTTDRLIFLQNANVKSSIQFLGHGRSKNQIKLQMGADVHIYKAGDVLNVALTNDVDNTILLEVVSIEDKIIKLVLSAQVKNISTVLKNQFDIARYTKSIKNEIALLAVDEKVPVSLKVFAARPVWFSYQADSDSEKQGFLDEEKSLELNFIQGVRLMFSNAGNVTIEIVGMKNPIRGGVTGESSQSIFYKKRSASGFTLHRALLK